MATQARVQPQLVEQPATAGLLDSIVERQAIAAERYMPTLTVKQFSDREKMLRELKEMLVEGTDYGVIPGTNKPTLLKPGAEKICAFFGYAPHYTESARSIQDWSGERYGEPLFYHEYSCTLAKDGKPVGQGIGSCSSWESKYRYRSGKRKCPACGSEAIIAGKAEYGGGFLCYGKKGGCGAKFSDNDPAITAQSTGKVPNPDIADIINTVQKMAQKRAYIAATLSATGASQYFTQDLEDMEHPVDSNGRPIDTGGHPVGTQGAANHVRDQKLAQTRQALPPAAARPQAASPAPPAGDVPAPVQQLWQQMGTKISGVCEAFDGLKRGFVGMLGDQSGEHEYYAVLGKHGWSHANDVRKSDVGGITKARQIARELYERLTHLAQTQDPPLPTQAAASTPDTAHEAGLAGADDRDDWLPEGFGEGK